MTGTATEHSAGLMRLAADGDEVAFARIVDTYHADMSSVCFVMTGGDAELAEEAVQSAWPIAWRKLHTVRDPKRLRPWLVSIAVNEARPTTLYGDAEHTGYKPAYSPDGTRIVFGCDGDLCLMDADGSNVVKRIDVGGIELNHFAWGVTPKAAP